MKKMLSLLTHVFFSFFLIVSVLPSAFASNTSMKFSTTDIQFNNRTIADTEIVTITLIGDAADADVSLTYEILPERQNVISAFWDANWHDNSIALILTPEGNGSVTIRITNDFNDDSQLLTVSVNDLGPLPTYSPATCSAVPTHNPIYVNNRLITNIPVYNINNSNYFKLRDISYLMNFGVAWNNNKRCVEINTTQNSDGTQVSTRAATQTKTATISTQPIYIDGTLYSNMTVYQIDGNNYFKLRDLAQNVDFGCLYDASVKAVRLDSNYHYNSNNIFGNSKNTSSYTYYTSYAAVPDFSSVTGASLYKQHKGTDDILYYYNADFNTDGIKQYQQILQQNKFSHFSSYTNDDGENIDIFTGNGLAVMCGWEQQWYSVYILEDTITGNNKDALQQYKVYPDYPDVPDFGSYTTASIYSTDARDGQGVIYTYYNDFSSSKLDSYKNLLLNKGFSYMGYNSSVNAYIYSGHGLRIFLNYVPNTNNRYFMLGIFK